VEAAGAIADMIESAVAADAVLLAQRAVERVTAAMLHMDDSSGIIGGDLRMLTALLRACSPRSATQFPMIRSVREPSSLTSQRPPPQTPLATVDRHVLARLAARQGGGSGGWSSRRLSHPNAFQGSWWWVVASRSASAAPRSR
jgi:hypothetical protein